MNSKSTFLKLFKSLLQLLEGGLIPLGLNLLVIVSFTFSFHSTAAENDVVLSVKPKLCVLSNQRQTCKDKIIISWQSSKARSLCLFSNIKQVSLACWSDSWSGRTEQLIKTQESLEFYLKEKLPGNNIKNNQQQIVAQKKLEVIKKFARRNKRSRKRHPWSIF